MPLKKEQLRFGVEFEFSTSLPKNFIHKFKVSGWNITKERSVKNGLEYKPKDKHFLFFKKDSLEEIKSILILIKHIFKGKTNENYCGCHIHVDMQKYSNKQILNIYNSFIEQENYFYKKFNVNIRRESIYAKRIKKAYCITEGIISEIKTLGETPSFYLERHLGLNLLSLYTHNSLEFRIFNGTLEYKKVLAYISFALDFCLNNSN